MATIVTFQLDDGSEVEAEVDEQVARHLVSGIPFLGEKYRRDVQRAEYLRRRTNTDPFMYKAPESTSRTFIRGEPQVTAGTRISEDELNRRTLLSQGGISVGPGPFNRAEISYFQGLAKDSPHEFANFFVPRVKEKIAPDEDVDPRHLVRVGEDGKVRFLDLQTKQNPAGTNRWTEFEGLGINPFTPLEIGLDITGSVGGVAAARRLGLKPFKEAAATAFGAATGASEAELLRLLLGKAHGITGPVSNDPNDPAWKESLAVLGEASSRGLWAGAGSMVGSGIGRGFHNYYKTVNPYFFNRDTASNYLTNMKEGEQIASQVRNLPGGAGFAPDLAQLTGEESLLTLRATLLNRAGGTSEMGITGRLLEADQTNNRILNNVLSDLLTGPKVTAYDAGIALQGANLAAIAKMAPTKQRQEILRLLRENAKDTKALGPITEVTEAGRSSILRRIRGAQEETSGVLTVQEATGLERILQNYKNIETSAWKEYERVAGEVQKNLGYPMQIKLVGNRDPSLDLMPRLSGLVDQADRLWSPQAKRRFSSVLDPLRQAVADAPDGMVDLRTINANLSAMKESLRIAKKEIGQESPSVGALEAAVKELQSVRDNYVNNVLRNPVVGDALLKAEESTRRVHDLTRRTVASKMLVKDSSGAYKIRNPDAAFDDVMVPGSDDGMRQWLDIVGEDPALIQATKEWYGQHYYASVIRDGLADPKAHGAWVRDYGPQAKLLFKDEFPAIQRLGQIGSQITRARERLTRLEATLRSSSRGKIERADPEILVEKIMGFGAKEGSINRVRSNLTQGEALHILQILKKDAPEVFATVQDRTREMIRLGVFGDPALRQGSKALSSEALAKVLNESSMGKLSYLFGPKYVSDLLTLKRGVTLLERSGKGTALPMETPTLSVFRAVFGPLSRTQRFISAGRRYSIIGQEKKLAEIISDPAKLRKIMDIANAPANSPFAISTLMSLGFLEATD